MGKFKATLIAIYAIYEFLVLAHLFAVNRVAFERKDMFELILSIIHEGLPILDKLVPDEATKIRNRVLLLRSQWDVEMSKGSLRDDAKLDGLRTELRDIGELFASTLKQAASTN